MRAPQADTGQRGILALATAGLRGCGNDAGDCIPLAKFEIDAVDTLSVATLAYTCHINLFTVQRELEDPTPARWRRVWSSCTLAFNPSLVRFFARIARR
jgi:amino acid permease